MDEVLQVQRGPVFFGVYDLRESKMVRYRLYESREEALEAAGLPE